MKNSKFMALIKLVLVLLVSAGVGYLIMQEPVIEYKVKKKVVSEEKDTKDSEAKDDKKAEEETEENSEADAKEETKEELKDDEFETKTIKNPLSYKNVDLGLDLAGGVSVVYRAMTENAPSDKEMQSAIQLLRTRLTLKGHTEAEVSGQGVDKIRVEMPGVDNPQQAVDEIGQTAELKFYGVSSDKYMPYPVQMGEGAIGYVLVDKNATGGEDMQIYNGSNIEEIGEFIVSGINIKDAYETRKQMSNVGGAETVVVLEFDNEGTKAFADGTKKFINNYIAIALDDALISVPNVSVEIINGEAIITGMASLDEAKNLANLIKSGSLPFKLEPVETNIIGARLGGNALTSSIKAGVIGLILVAIFMIMVYAFPGFVADMALSIYTLLIVAVLASCNVTLTLPGIAGIILSIGMAVDANVIIFTRIKEELVLGKTLNSAIESGFEKAKSAILDGNITTLIIAVILYAKGIGTIRGFAQTLALGIVVSMFTALVITKFILKTFVKLGVKNLAFFGVTKVKEKNKINTKMVNNK